MGETALGADKSIDRNVSAIHKLRIEADQNRTRLQKLVDSVAAFIGSTKSLIFHVALYGLLIASNVVSSAFFQSKFGMTLSTTELIATIEAIFLSVFVLINQRRQNAISRRHSDLDLQIGLLTENELTEIANVMVLIAKKLEIDPQALNKLRTVGRLVHPDEIVERLSSQEQAAPTALTADPDLKRAHDVPEADI